MVNWLFVATCLIFFVGCSSLKSSQEQQAPAYHNSPMKLFVDGWLTGDSPPPDFSLGGNNGGWGWYYFVGWPFELLGPALTK
jgi:hypothetical protein